MEACYSWGMAKKITALTSKGKVVTYKAPRVKVVDLPATAAPRTGWQKFIRNAVG